MKNKVWKIIAIFLLMVFFGFQIYRSIDQRWQQKKQQQMLEDLAREEAQQRMHQYDDNITRFSDSVVNKLDSVQRALDSIGAELKRGQEEFERKMKK